MNSKSTIAIAPGETIKEQLAYRNISQKDFALRMNTSEKHICNLLNGKTLLTYEMSMKLESVLGIEASFWNELEKIYREKLEKVKHEIEMEDDIEKLSSFPYNEMQKLGWIDKVSNKIDKVKILRNYFEVSSLSNVENIYKNIAIYRVASQVNIKTLSWVQKINIESRKKEVSKINLTKLKNDISKIKLLITKTPNEFSVELISILANSGIVLIYLPHLEGSQIHGVTFKQGNKIVLGISTRGMYSDKFWFTLFHEIGHILNQDYIEVKENSEELANIFARDTLIDKDEYSMFISNKSFSRGSIKKFALKINVLESIVVGRLQKDNYINFSDYNDLRNQYIIK